MHCVAPRRRAGRCLLLLLMFRLWGNPVSAAALPVLVSPQLPPQVSLFLTAVPPERVLMLRLRRFDARTGFVPVDSLRLTTDGPLTLTDRTAGADPARPALYEVALDRYSRTEVILRPGEVPHAAATVPQLAREGVYWQQSPENTAYQRTLAEVQVLDSAIARATEIVRGLPDTAARARTAALRELERRHRALAAACAQEPLRHAPATSFAATVLARLARYPTRPAALAFTPGYLPWLAEALAADFPLTTDEALRHYAAAARLAQRVWQMGPLLPGGPTGVADALLTRRQGHDAVNAWLYQSLLAEAARRDDDALARHLRLDYPPDACAPALPAALTQQLQQMAELTPGAVVPDLWAPDSGGHRISLRATAARHRLTAVVAWVSWCHTCETELPKLAAAYPALRARGLEVVTLSLDETRVPWVAALRRQRPPWPLSLAELTPLAQSQTARQLHVRLTPKLLLLDAHGRLVGRYASTTELAAAAEAYLRQP